MSSFFGLISTIIFCITLLGIALMVVIAIPQSGMREIIRDVISAVTGNTSSRSRTHRDDLN